MPWVLILIFVIIACIVQFFVANHNLIFITLVVVAILVSLVVVLGEGELYPEASHRFVNV